MRPPSQPIKTRCSGKVLSSQLLGSISRRIIVQAIWDKCETLFEKYLQ
jgi:hypothetical protein